MFRFSRIVVVSLMVTHPSLAQSPLHVDPNATQTPHDGTSWENAFVTLQDALAIAEPGDVIWVADGTYTVPSQAGYVIADNDVRLYGGFDGGTTNETLLEQRNLHKHVAILTGDITGDDDPDDPFNPALIDDNANHVVVVGSTIEDAWIDGFTITGGIADGPGTAEGNGGGIHCATSDKVTIANIIFKHNCADGNGGGLCYTGGDSTSALVNCTFIGNETDASGGGAYIEGPIEQVTNCAFAANIAFFEGGGLANFSGTKIIVSQCSFSKNDAGAANTRRGSGLFCAPGPDAAVTTDDSTADIRNCIFWDNGEGESESWLSATETTAFFQSNHCFEGCCGGRYLLSRPEADTVFDRTQTMQRALDVRVAVPLIAVTDCNFTTCEYAAAHILYDVGETWFDQFYASAILGGDDSYAVRGAVGKLRWRNGAMTNDADKAIIRVWLTTDGIIENYSFSGGRVWLGGSSSDGPPIYGFSNVTFRNCDFEVADDSFYNEQNELVDPAALDIKENTHHVRFENCDFAHFGPLENFADFATTSGGTPWAHAITFIECTYSYDGEDPDALDYADLGSFDEAQNITIVSAVPDPDHREVRQFYAPNNYEGSSVKFSDIEGLISYGTAGYTFDTEDSGNINVNPQFADPFSNLRLADCSPCIDAGDNDLVPGETGTGITGDAADLDYGNDPNEVLPSDGSLAPRIVDNPNVTPNGDAIVDMGAYEIPGCATPADLFPVCRVACGFGDGCVEAGDLAQLLVQWGSCPDCCADIAPVGALDDYVGAADLAELLANWGNVPEDCGGDGFSGGGGGSEGNDDDASDDSGYYDALDADPAFYDWALGATIDELMNWLDTGEWGG